MTEDLSTTLPLSVLVNERHQHPDPSSLPPRGTGLWVGPFRGTRRGQGTDFDDLRNYAAGDEVRHVDWKVSARRGTLHTRLYREEKEHVMTFVADFRNAMFTGSRELLSVTTGRLLAGLAWHAIDAGSRVSMMIITDNGIQSTRPASGHKSAIAACGLLASAFASASHAASLATGHADSYAVGASDEQSSNTMHTALEELLGLGRRVGTVVLASNFADVGHEQRVAMLGMLSQARPVVAIHMEDALCVDGLPAGRYRYLSRRHGGLTPRMTQLRGSDQRKLREHLAAQQAVIIEHFRSAKVTLLDGRIGLPRIKAELRHQGFLS